MGPPQNNVMVLLQVFWYVNCSTGGGVLNEVNKMCHQQECYTGQKPRWPLEKEAFALSIVQCFCNNM